MSIAESARSPIGLWLAACLACLLLAAGPAAAHPVAQGAMEIRVLPGKVELRAKVSLEEVLVAGALGGRKDTVGGEALGAHGGYLLRHIGVAAEGRRLSGRVLETPTRPESFLVYRFEYPLEGAQPRRLELRQDVLREFEFAPGNPWEASYLVRMVRDGRPEGEGRLLTFREPLAFDVAEADRGSMARDFLRHGIIHILTGYDHLLFVGALALAVAGFWDLVKVITAFTLAHTLTLVLSVLGLVRLSSAIVEPMIAASIVVVATQNLFWPERSRGWGRLGVAFGFGLFHGLGFAGGLLDAMADMPPAGAALAIAAFSLGVEIGHQFVVLPAFFGRRLIRGEPGGLRLQRYGSAMISMAGLVYLYWALR